ncbi:MAG: DUF6702 family protein [Planctomycetota bacterium]
MVERRTAFAAALAVAALLGPARAVELHPADEAYAEVEYVPERGLLECAVSFDGLTLDRALSAFVGRDVRLEDPKGEVAAAAYLDLGLRFEYRAARCADDEWIPCEQVFVGSEIDGPVSWLYAEVPVPGEPVDLRATFEVLFDLTTAQRNVMLTTSPSGRRGHRFVWSSGYADVSYLARPPAAGS